MSERARFINPYTDFGFKKLFGEEANKDLLIDFLNQLLPEEHQIESLTFRNVEAIANLNQTEYDAYQKSRLYYLDMINMIKTQLEEGIEQGIEQGIEKIAIRCLRQGKTITEVCDITGLSEDQVKAIRQRIK